MEEFLAIRRHSRLERGILSENSSSEQKSKEIRARIGTQLSDRAQRLVQDIKLIPLKPQNIDSPPSVIISPGHTGVFSSMRFLGAYYVKTDDKQQAEEAKDVFNNDFFIVENAKFNLPTTTRTELRGSRRVVSEQWPEASGIKKAHDNGIDGSNVRVMVLDTGCDADHAQFAHKRINYRFIDPLNPRQRRDVRGFDTQGHGTHVCGIISGKDVGVAPETDLYVASVIESESAYTSLNRILEGLDWLLSAATLEPKPTILNMSLGFDPKLLKTSSLQMLMESVQSALQILLEDFSILPVIASGNNGAGSYLFPGAFHEALSVGAVTFDQQIAEFTSRGQFNIGSLPRKVPDIWGYGDKVYSSLERNNDNRSVYALKSGTSMATPYVVGIAALYAQLTGYQGTELRDHLLQNAVMTDFGKLASYQ